jgi:3-oxoadipyl-CoA thiolase
MTEAFICDAVRTPVGRYGGALATVRADDLAALPIAALLGRHPDLKWNEVDDIVYGCANQAGEDNRNVARMAGLLAGLPVEVPGTTVNRLCGSSLDAVGMAARALRSWDADLVIAGGVESMSRAPFVMPKSESAFSRANSVYDTTIGWRFINPLMKKGFGVDTMPETGENVADDFKVSRSDQDAFALASHRRWAAAQQAERFASEIVPVSIAQKKGDAKVFAIDEQPRPDSSLESLGKLKGVVRPDGSVTAGNASSVNDGAAALLLASASGVSRHGLRPLARVLACVSTGVMPRIMGMGPVPAVQRVLAKTGLTLAHMDVIELNEAFAAQSLAVLRQLGLPEDSEHVNPNGGAIAIGHPLGMSGARLVTTAVYELHRRQGRYALCTMCVGVGQGVALVIERV